MLLALSVAIVMIIEFWQIIPNDSPIILFFYSQNFSLLFSQTSPLFSIIPKA